MKNKVALVTGAGRGIGKAISIGLAGQKMDLCVIARTQSELEQTAIEIRKKTSQRVITCVADIGNYHELINAFNNIDDQYGRLDIVVANAGIMGKKGLIENLEPEDWEEVFRVNVLGLMNTCKLSIPLLSKSGGGNIITIGSGIGHRGGKEVAAYAAAKAASWIITKSLAQELESKNILVNELIPGPVKTTMNPGAKGAGWKQPEDVVPLALYLANLNSDGPTGQSFSLMRI